MKAMILNQGYSKIFLFFVFCIIYDHLKTLDTTHKHFILQIKALNDNFRIIK